MFNQQIIALLGINPNVVNGNTPSNNDLISDDGIQLISESGEDLIAE